MNNLICGNEHQIMGQALADQHPIKGITMQGGQGDKFAHAVFIKGQTGYLVLFSLEGQVNVGGLGQRQFA